MSLSSTFDSSSPTPPPPSRPRAPEFLPAIHIRSQPLPSHFLPLEDPSDYRHATTAAPQHPSDVWKEWYLASSKHGPDRVKGPPVFVLAQGDYDELGRSTIDGIGVDVENAIAARQREKETGESLADWYAALLGAESGANTPEIDTARQVVKVGKEDAIDLTMISDDEDEVKPIIGLDAGSHNQNAGIPLRVNPNEWFIRRALLKRHHNAPTDPPVKPSRTISIGSLIGITPIQQIKSSPKYALGPENKGYDILKNTLGWGGGGLGKPEGWAPRLDGRDAEIGPSAPQDLVRQLERDNLAEASSSRFPLGTSIATPAVKMETGVIDFTADTDDEVEADMSDDSPSDFEEPNSDLGGPGRTVPIATTLKLDRLGLGHRRTNFDAKGNPLKRVTHTHKEIEEAQRRAKRPIEKKAMDLEKKAKIKWSLKDKRERDERRRIAAALNA